MAEYYILWNKDRNKGFIFEDLVDAKHAANIKKVRGCRSSLSDEFNEMYASHGKLKVEKVTP